MPIEKIHHRWRSLGRGVRRTIIVIVLILVLARIALPYAVTAYVNRQLDKVPEYEGRIGDVDVHLFRGAYQIHDISILKTTGDVPVPFMSAKKVDLSVEWSELFHGAIVGEVVMEQPELNFVEGPTEEQSQTGKNKEWGKTLESLFPFNINRFEIKNGRVHFRNFHSSPRVDIFVTNLFAIATNLHNSRDSTDKLPAAVIAKGWTYDGGQLDVDLRLNPLAAKPTFELNAQITNANLVAMNDFLRAYGKFDVEKGTFSVFTSIASAEGQYDGYAKILFQDLDVFAWEKERKKNILQVFWQAIVGATTTIFKNHPRDQLATKIPISGNFEGADVGVWTAVGTLLQNAFIRALLPKLDEAIPVEEVEKKVEKEPSSQPVDTGETP
jgi:hypothetical protein